MLKFYQKKKNKSSSRRKTAKQKIDFPYCPHPLGGRSVIQHVGWQANGFLFA